MPDGQIEFYSQEFVFCRHFQTNVLPHSYSLLILLLYLFLRQAIKIGLVTMQIEVTTRHIFSNLLLPK